MAIKVLIVDDSPTMRALLRLMLEREHDLEIVGAAANAMEARGLIRELNPDLLGDRVPDWAGEKFILRVPREAEPRARVLLPELIASSDRSDECVPHAFDWGRQRFTTAMASRCEHVAAVSR